MNLAGYINFDFSQWNIPYFRNLRVNPVASSKLEMVYGTYLFPCLGSGIEGPDGVDILVKDDVVECVISVSVYKGRITN